MIETNGGICNVDYWKQYTFKHVFRLNKMDIIRTHSTITYFSNVMWEGIRLQASIWYFCRHIIDYLIEKAIN